MSRTARRIARAVAERSDAKGRPRRDRRRMHCTTRGPARCCWSTATTFGGVPCVTDGGNAAQGRGRDAPMRPGRGPPHSTASLPADSTGLHGTANTAGHSSGLRRRDALPGLTSYRETCSDEVLHPEGRHGRRHGHRDCARARRRHARAGREPGGAGAVADARDVAAHRRRRGGARSRPPAPAQCPREDAEQVDGLEDYPVFTRKTYTDVCYLACARRLLAQHDAVFPQFATHNAHTLSAVHRMAGPDFKAGDLISVPARHGRDALRARRWRRDPRPPPAASMRPSARMRRCLRISCAGCWRMAPTPPSFTSWRMGRSHREPHRRSCRGGGPMMGGRRIRLSCRRKTC